MGLPQLLMPALGAMGGAGAAVPALGAGLAGAASPLTAGLLGPAAAGAGGIAGAATPFTAGLLGPVSGAGAIPPMNLPASLPPPPPPPPPPAPVITGQVPPTGTLTAADMAIPSGGIEAPTINTAPSDMLYSGGPGTQYDPQMVKAIQEGQLSGLDRPQAELYRQYAGTGPDFTQQQAMSGGRPLPTQRIDTPVMAGDPAQIQQAAAPVGGQQMPPNVSAAQLEAFQGIPETPIGATQAPPNVTTAQLENFQGIPEVSQPSIPDVNTAQMENLMGVTDQGAATTSQDLMANLEPDPVQTQAIIDENIHGVNRGLKTDMMTDTRPDQVVNRALKADQLPRGEHGVMSMNTADQLQMATQPPEGLADFYRSQLPQQPQIGMVGGAGTPAGTEGLADIYRSRLPAPMTGWEATATQGTGLPPSGTLTGADMALQPPQAAQQALITGWEANVTPGSGGAQITAPVQTEGGGLLGDVRSAVQAANTRLGQAATSPLFRTGMGLLSAGHTGADPFAAVSAQLAGIKPGQYNKELEDALKQLQAPKAGGGRGKKKGRRRAKDEDASVIRG